MIDRTKHVLSHAHDNSFRRLLRFGSPSTRTYIQSGDGMQETGGMEYVIYQPSVYLHLLRLLNPSPQSTPSDNGRKVVTI